MKVKDIDELDENWQINLFYQYGCVPKLAFQPPAVVPSTFRDNVHTYRLIHRITKFVHTYRLHNRITQFNFV